MGAKYLVSNTIFHGRMNHVEIDYHFVRDRVLKKLLEVCFIATIDQLGSPNRYWKEDLNFSTIST
jgi:hypothetical protein